MLKLTRAMVLLYICALIAGAALAQRQPELVMDDPALKVFEGRAQRTVAKAKASAPGRRGASVNTTAPRRPSVPSDIVTPSAGSGSSPEAIATANRWCRSMGYEWLCGRGDFVDRWWRIVNGGRAIDPATLAAEEGFDSPSVDCNFRYDAQQPEVKHWPAIEITRNGIKHVIPTEGRCTPAGKCEFLFTAPCVNEKWPSTYRFIATRNLCVNAATGAISEPPCQQ